MGSDRCDPGEHDLRWDDEHGRLACTRCGMTSDDIVRQPQISDS